VMAMTCSHGITKNPDELHQADEGAWLYEQHSLGFNYRMTDLQAALGNSQLNQLSDFVSKRNLLANGYHQHFSDTDIDVFMPLANSLSAFHLLIIKLPAHCDRKRIFEAMREAGIGVHVHYIPIHLQPYYQALGFNKGDFPAAEAYYQSCLTLPLFPNLTTEEQDYICDTLKGLVN
ncbi:DegT/DnrJ/EryC1/StrS family aminotransferase, partial [Shewanella sp. TC10]|uniref:DegT/DnrJ/EryC1/StrS family aminotransferase n=1 Tax=Shewanella sp. TC10 TaxID=1419739 RepID=UPI001892A88E